MVYGRCRRQLRCAGGHSALPRPPLVISIDPDNNGALAVVRVQELPAEDAREIADASVTLYDNPCQILQTKTGGKRRCAALCHTLFMSCPLVPLVCPSSSFPFLQSIEACS